MQRVCSKAEAVKDLARILAAARQGGETIIQQDDQPVAVVMGYEVYQSLLEARRYLEERRARFAVYDEIRSRGPDALPERVADDIEAALNAVRDRGAG
jgi:antitoxin (DNA-binding transcriptional repressor) of toxin-antitoxin stability system